MSVLIPARNEALYIRSVLEGLARQTYPAELLEVLVIDDHSTDGTAEVACKFIEQRGLHHFRVLSHRADGIQPTYKKAAITFGLQYARGELILATDADCRVQPDWVASMVRHYGPRTGLVAGLITFEKRLEKGLFQKLQTLEFAGLVFAGVGAAGIGKPLICNGANLSYRRKAFDEVGGFRGHDHLPSGDDDLLMQNIHRKTDWEVRFNLDPASIVYTRPVKTLGQFYNQRARWASKGVHYPGMSTFLLLLAIYLFYLLLLGAGAGWLAGWVSGRWLAAGLALKVLPELLVVSQALAVLGRRDLLIYLPLAELAHIPYIVLMGFAGFFKLFRWKPEPTPERQP
ncbi:MAG: glycosyltransferase [Calditrichaeota bacterium]|nr:MAG: glycosyltransferase [Calditrichota bacterium]